MKRSKSRRLGYIKIFRLDLLCRQNWLAHKLYQIKTAKTLMKSLSMKNRRLLFSVLLVKFSTILDLWTGANQNLFKGHEWAPSHTLDTPVLI